MANFEEALSVVPTQTVGGSPVVLDTSSLAVAKLAESLTGQFLDFKQKERQQQQLNAEAKVLSGVQTGIFDLANAAEAGAITLTEANTKSILLTQKAIAQNPMLSKEIGQVFTSTRSSSGLSAGKSQAQLRQEAQEAARKELEERGWISAGATAEEAVPLYAALQEQKKSEQSLKLHVAELDSVNKNLTLSAKQREAQAAATTDLVKKDIRSIANSQYTRIASEVNRLNSLLVDSPESRKDIFEQLEVLESQLIKSIGPGSRSLLSPSEFEALTGPYLEPINILKQRIQENRPAKWAKDNIESVVALTTERAMQDPAFRALHVFSRNIGEASVSRFATNTLYAEYASKLLSGKGGTGTEAVEPATKAEVTTLVKQAAAKKQITEQDLESLSNLIEGTIKDAVTDDAQGRISTPADLSSAIKMLSDPNVQSKVVSGELQLDEATLQRGQRVVQDTYLDKILPSINSQIGFTNSELGDKPLGQLIDFRIENGVFVAKPSQELTAIRAKLEKQAQEADTPGAAATSAAAFSQLKQAERGLQETVAAANQAARAMATLSKSSKLEPFIVPLVEGLFRGEEND